METKQIRDAGERVLNDLYFSFGDEVVVNECVVDMAAFNDGFAGHVHIYEFIEDDLSLDEDGTIDDNKLSLMGEDRVDIIAMQRISALNLEIEVKSDILFFVVCANY